MNRRVFPDEPALAIAALIRKLPGAMINRVHVRQAHTALHVLWTKHAKEPGYDKSLWFELDAAIHLLSTDGPGEAIPWEPGDTPPAPPPAGGSEPGSDR